MRMHVVLEASADTFDEPLCVVSEGFVADCADKPANYHAKPGKGDEVAAILARHAVF